MDYQKLGDLVNIRSGLVLSRKISIEKTPYMYNLLTLRSIISESDIDIKMLDPAFMSEELKKSYLTQDGDIIIRLSSPYTAVLIDVEKAGYVISSNFVVMRDYQGIDLNYLFWFLNTVKLKNDILRNCTGCLFGPIQSSYYTNLEIVLPSLVKQKQIGDIYMLSIRESRLLAELQKQKKLYSKLVIEYIQSDIREENI